MTNKDVARPNRLNISRDIFFQILDHLSWYEVLALEQTCKGFRGNIYNNHGYWKGRCQQIGGAYQQEKYPYLSLRKAIKKIKKLEEVILYDKAIPQDFQKAKIIRAVVAEGKADPQVAVAALCYPPCWWLIQYSLAYLRDITAYHASFWKQHLGEPYQEEEDPRQSFIDAVVTIHNIIQKHDTLEALRLILAQGTNDPKVVIAALHYQPSWTLFIWKDVESIANVYNKKPIILRIISTKLIQEGGISAAIRLRNKFGAQPDKIVVDTVFTKLMQKGMDDEAALLKEAFNAQSDLRLLTQSCCESIKATNRSVSS